MAAKKKTAGPKKPLEQELLAEGSPPLSKKDPDFRENPERAIDVFGPIGPDLIRQLTPQVRHLRSQDPCKPITVYIDSEGGSVQSCEHLEGLLFQPDQDGNRCRIVTVATSLAASAAARLLARGDCTLAYKNATVHCHGTRYQGTYELTRERAFSMGQSLSAFNDEMATVFMHRIIENFTWLYQLNKKAIEERSPNTTGIPGLSNLIHAKLQPVNRALMDGVLSELNLVTELETFLHAPSRYTSLNKARMRGRGAYEFRLLKHIVDFLEKRAGTDLTSSLRNTTISQLTDLYSLRRDYYERFIKDCEDPDPLLRMFCTAEDLREAESKPEEARSDYLFEKGGTELFSAWQLATTISANLVRGENSLSASDAYWLGLVEEVIGDPSLPCRRNLIEQLA